MTHYDDPNLTDGHGMSDHNFALIWERIAALDADQVALVGNGRQRTFGEFERRAEHLAGYMGQHGLSPGDSVGLLLHNRLEYLEAFFAASKLRCVPFNINYRYRSQEIAFLLDNARAGALVFERTLRAEVDEAITFANVDPLLIECSYEGGNGSPEPSAVTFEQAVAAGPTDRVRTQLSGRDLIYLYTGGTTGMPKAVMWRHEDLIEALWQLNRFGQPMPDPLDAIRDGKRALTSLPASPLMHGTALFIALQTLAGGGTVVLDEGPRFDATRTIDAIRSHEVSLLSIVGDAFARPLLNVLRRAPVELPSLRVVVSSGVQWSLGAKEELLERLPDLRLIDSLGSSEGPASQSISTRSNVTAAPRFKLGGRMRVIDDEGCNVVPGSGQVGMLATVGAGPIGYLGDPEKSAMTFREVGGLRMTISGDYATVEVDETITFLGRGSSCINTGGEKVFPEEVETVLRTHPSVDDCAVVGVSDPRWGARVVALVQAVSDPPGDLEAELDAACLIGLAAYKRPKDYIRVKSLNRSAAGKLDLAALEVLASNSLGHSGSL